MRYGIRRRLRRGIRVCIFPTYRCNLSCPYCSNNLERSGTIFRSEEIRPLDWERLIKNFPVKIREVVISGGEPLLYFEIQRLILLLLDLDLMVMMNSNLMIKRNLSILKSDRLRVEATLHEGVDKTKFYSNVQHYRQWFKVDVDFFTDHNWPIRFLGFKGKKLMSEDESYLCLDMKRFKFTPDGRLWINDREIGDTYTIQ